MLTTLAKKLPSSNPFISPNHKTLSVIREATLSTIFQAIFEKITSSDLLKFVSEKEVRAEIKKWESMLLKIHDVLDGAEEKQIVNRSMKRWLDDLHD